MYAVFLNVFNEFSYVLEVNLLDYSRTLKAIQYICSAASRALCTATAL